MIEQSNPVQQVNQPIVHRPHDTTGLLTVFEHEAYFTDNSGGYDVIASSPQVKDALRGLGRGAYVAELNGQVYPRQSGETGFETFSLNVVASLKELTGAVSRPHGPGSVWMMEVGGRSLELHPKTDDVKLSLDSAGLQGEMQVVGKVDGDHIDVWQVNGKVSKKLPGRPPVMQQQGGNQADQSVRVGGQTNKYC